MAHLARAAAANEGGGEYDDGSKRARGEPCSGACVRAASVAGVARRLAARARRVRSGACARQHARVRLEIRAE
eukprot:4342519-Prymnesium_polylepis.1